MVMSSEGASALMAEESSCQWLAGGLHQEKLTHGDMISRFEWPQLSTLRRLPVKVIQRLDGGYLFR